MSMDISETKEKMAGQLQILKEVSFGWWATDHVPFMTLIEIRRQSRSHFPSIGDSSPGEWGKQSRIFQRFLWKTSDQPSVILLIFNGQCLAGYSPAYSLPSNHLNCKVCANNLRQHSLMIVAVACVTSNMGGTLGRLTLLSPPLPRFTHSVLVKILFCKPSSCC